MKNLKRKYVYAVLALPFIAFGLFAVTLDPITRDGFFSDFKRNTSTLFGVESDTELATPIDGISDGGPTSEDREFGSGGPGGDDGRRGPGRGGGFGGDPREGKPDRPQRPEME